MFGVNVACIGAGEGVGGAGGLGDVGPLRGPLPRACYWPVPGGCAKGRDANLLMWAHVRVALLKLVLLS